MPSAGADLWEESELLPHTHGTVSIRVPGADAGPSVAMLMFMVSCLRSVGGPRGGRRRRTGVSLVLHAIA